jgi:hypothetical protein
MTCASEHSKSLIILKQLMKRNDLVEISTSKYGKDTARINDYFPEKYAGSPKRLRRYMQRALTYTAIMARNERSRADMMAEGPGLTDMCVNDLETAAKIPLPGFEDTYGEDKLSQKKRLLNLLLTFVILFHREEPTLALSDLALKGPMLTGAPRLFQMLTSGARPLPEQYIEELLIKAIYKAEGNQGGTLVKSFQNKLDIMKSIDQEYAESEHKHMKLLYNSNNYLYILTEIGCYHH